MNFLIEIKERDQIYVYNKQFKHYFALFISKIIYLLVFRYDSIRIYTSGFIYMSALTHLWSKRDDLAYAASNVGTFAAFLGLELRMPKDLPTGDIQKLK